MPIVSLVCLRLGKLVIGKSLIYSFTAFMLQQQAIKKKAVLSQREPRDAAVYFDTYQIIQYRYVMYAKQGNLVDTVACGTKASTKRLKVKG